MSWFWILGIPAYMILALVCISWFSIDFLVRLFSGAGFDELILFWWINIVVSWNFMLGFFMTIVPFVNFLVPIFGFLVYLYIAFMGQPDNRQDDE